MSATATLPHAGHPWALPLAFPAGSRRCRRHEQVSAGGCGRLRPVQPGCCSRCWGLLAPGQTIRGKREPLAAGVHGISTASWMRPAEDPAPERRPCMWVEADNDLPNRRTPRPTKTHRSRRGAAGHRRRHPNWNAGCRPRSSVARPTAPSTISTVIAIDHADRGFIHERRFRPNGVFAGGVRAAQTTTDRGHDVAPVRLSARHRERLQQDSKMKRWRTSR